MFFSEAIIQALGGGQAVAVVNPDGSPIAADATLTQRMTYDSEDRLKYLAEAVAGATLSQEVWRIREFNYDGTTDRVVSILFADGSSAFQQEATDPASLTYT